MSAQSMHGRTESGQPQRLRGTETGKQPQKSQNAQNAIVEFGRRTTALSLCVSVAIPQGAR